MTEAWRLCWKVETLRRFSGYAISGYINSGIRSPRSNISRRCFDLDERTRGFIAAGVEPAQLLGLIVGWARSELVSRDPALILRPLAVSVFVGSLFVIGFAISPTVWMAVGSSALLTFSFAILGPGLIAALSLAPLRARAMGFSMGSLWALPGLFALPLVGWVGDKWGIRVGIMVMTPILLVGVFIVSSAANGIRRDIEQVRASARARSSLARP